jgi:methylenetetrahydrofolate reductase (NADPH)
MRNDFLDQGIFNVTMRELYNQGDLVLSFEVFPPKTPQGLEAVYRTVEELKSYKPGFISVTYGAGGSTQSQTLDIINQIARRFELPTTAHFTIVGSTRDAIDSFLSEAREAGANNIMALRGDPPAGEKSFKPVEGGLRYAVELVEVIRSKHPHFGIGVAGYPETHQEARSPEDDLANLKRKVDAGADAVFTQLFYDNEDFLRFRDRCNKLGIIKPIVPGLLPVLSLAQVRRITGLCGSKLPSQLLSALEACGEDTAAQQQVGIDHCISQCEGLLAEGIPGIHYYVLNRADSTREILSKLFPAK